MGDEDGSGGGVGLEVDEAFDFVVLGAGCGEGQEE